MLFRKEVNFNEAKRGNSVDFNSLIRIMRVKRVFHSMYENEILGNRSNDHRVCTLQEALLILFQNYFGLT